MTTIAALTNYKILTKVKKYSMLLRTAILFYVCFTNQF
ncbi:hypothetical protein PHEL49_1264 [Polaribacter sp. Hel1_33_49]|nr:hypothetical protein PHEL49_1264 [Polaribacter sp. Hel1_33_49]